MKLNKRAAESAEWNHRRREHIKAILIIIVAIICFTIVAWVEEPHAMESFTVNTHAMVMNVGVDESGHYIRVMDDSERFHRARAENEGSTATLKRGVFIRVCMDIHLYEEDGTELMDINTYTIGDMWYCDEKGGRK